MFAGGGRWRESRREEKRTLLRMDFTTFRHAMMKVPAQVLSTGRRIINRFWRGILGKRLLPCWINFANRYVAEGTALKPESGRSGPSSPERTEAAEFDMTHETTRNSPDQAASAIMVSPGYVPKHHAERLRRSLVQG